MAALVLPTAPSRITATAAATAAGASFCALALW
jgi:hypothetical protein